MARSCGIRLGPRRYEIVVLDGSPKKHKIVAFEAGEFDPYSDDHLRAAASALKDVVKRLNAPKDNLGLVIDSGHAAFRRVSLPITDQAKIEQVLKFEVESELPQWSVEDVIVDWHMLGSSDASGDLLITAVPKEDIEAALSVTSGAGVEPFEVELETSAMVNAAWCAGLCNLDDAQVLVHIGDHSTSVVVMDSGEVREMRVIHIGALTHEVLAPQEPAEGSEEGEEGEDAAAPEIRSGMGEGDPIEASRRVDQAINRIRRELGRTLSGARTINPIEAVYVCGMELPGLIGSTVLDVPVHVLDCFEEDSGQPADGFGQLVVAYGAAVRELGGGLMKPSLRREELKYSGTWERIEFPLAVACLLLTTLLGVVWILQKRELSYLDDYGAKHWFDSSNNFLLGTVDMTYPGLMSPPPQELKDFRERFADRESRDPDLTTVEALAQVKRMVQEEVVGLQRKLGQDTSVRQPQSALVGAHLVLEVLGRDRQKWRPTIWKIDAQTQPAKSKNPEFVKVTLDLVFHAEDSTAATRAFEAFRAACKHIPGFRNMPLRGSAPLEHGGIKVMGQVVEINVQEYYDRLAQAAGSMRGGN
jgi:hypothetical protein